MRSFGRPRFSLLTALLLLTIAAMAAALWQSYAEMRPLRDEVRRLRQETGYLSIDDESRIHAIQVPQLRGDTRRCRVYLPAGRRYQLHTRIHTVPGRGPSETRADWLKKLPGSGGSTSLDPGEYVMDVALERDGQQGDNWNVIAAVTSGGSTSSTTIGSAMPWLSDPRTRTVSSDVPIGRQIERDPAEGLVLFELRQGILEERDRGYSVSSPDPGQETPGVVVWIVPEPTAKQ